jgi:uncharacterized protein YwgA
MDYPKRAALLTAVIDELRAHESWCGETHVQKAVYVLQEMFGVPLELPFILYKYGPFCFDLRDELSAMRADGFVDLELQPPYGPRFCVTETGEKWQRRYASTLDEHREAIRRVAQKLRDRPVDDLERLTTALLVTRQKDDPGTTEGRVERLLELKPHVSAELAADAVAEIEEWLAQS